MRYLAVTGPSSGITDLDLAVVEGWVGALDPKDVELYSGAARGVDTAVALAARLHGITCHLVVPGADHATNLVAEWQRSWPGDIIWMQRRQDPARAYRERNTQLCERAVDGLHAFTRGTTFYRSGEWMTINIARKLGREVTLHAL